MQNEILTVLNELEKFIEESDKQTGLDASPPNTRKLTRALSKLQNKLSGFNRPIIDGGKTLKDHPVRMQIAQAIAEFNRKPSNKNRHNLPSAYQEMFNKELDTIGKSQHEINPLSHYDDMFE